MDYLANSYSTAETFLTIPISVWPTVTSLAALVIGSIIAWRAHVQKLSQDRRVAVFVELMDAVSDANKGFGLLADQTPNQEAIVTSITSLARANLKVLAIADDETAQLSVELTNQYYERFVKLCALRNATTNAALGAFKATLFSELDELGTHLDAVLIAIRRALREKTSKKLISKVEEMRRRGMAVAKTLGQ